MSKDEKKSIPYAPKDSREAHRFRSQKMVSASQNFKKWRKRKAPARDTAGKFDPSCR